MYDEDDDYLDRVDDYPAGISGKHPLGNLELCNQFLAQEDKWCTAGGRYVEIARMGANHAANTVVFLLRRALDIATFSDLAARQLERWSTTISEAAAREWLSQQPLVMALSRRASTGIGVVKLPWE
jgi:hypothetical protein